MVKIFLAVVWLGVNLHSLLQIVRKPSIQLNTEQGPALVSSLVFNLRGLLSQRQEDIIQFQETLIGNAGLLKNFRNALLLTASGLLVELIVYGAITVSFDFWGALIFGGLVIATHIQTLILLGLLATLTSSRQWFILTYKKAQLLVMPTAIIEVLWLTFLLIWWVLR